MKNLIKMVQEDQKTIRNLLEKGDKFIQFLNDVCYDEDSIINDHFDVITALIAVNAAKEIDNIDDDYIVIDNFYYHNFTDVMIKYFYDNIIKFPIKEQKYVAIYATNIGNTKLLDFVGYSPEYPIKYDFNIVLLKKNDEYCHLINDDEINKEIEIYENNFYCKNKQKALDVLSEFFGINRTEINNYLNFKENEER